MARIMKLDMMPVEGCHDQYHRAFAANGATESTVNRIIEQTSGGRNFSPATLAGVAGEFMAPSAVVTGSANIFGGWRETRLRFRLLFTCQIGGPIVEHYYITGYTSTYGAITVASGMRMVFDPEMRFYFNNVSTVREMENHAPGGSGVVSNVVNTSHVLTHLYDNTRSPDGQAAYSMRPMDVFNTIATRSTTGDTRQSFLHGPMLSSRGNNNAAIYLGQTLTAFDTATSDAADAFRRTDPLKSAAGEVAEQTTSSNFFFMELMRKTQYKTRGYVTWAELVAMQPDLDSVTRVMKQDNQAMQVNALNTEHMRGNRHETVIANTLLHAIPSLIFDMKITKVWFTATNASGQPMTLIENLNTFMPNQQPEAYIRPMQNRINTTVMRDVSHNNQLLYDIRARIDVAGMSWLEISVNGQPHVPYMLPSYADSSTAPVVATERIALDTLSYHMHQLFGKLPDAGAAATIINDPTTHLTPQVQPMMPGPQHSGVVAPVQQPMFSANV